MVAAGGRLRFVRIRVPAENSETSEKAGAKTPDLTEIDAALEDVLRDDARAVDIKDSESHGVVSECFCSSTLKCLAALLGDFLLP
jgi:hypothetical protein